MLSINIFVQRFLAFLDFLSFLTSLFSWVIDPIYHELENISFPPSCRLCKYSLQTQCWKILKKVYNIVCSSCLLRKVYIPQGIKKQSNHQIPISQWFFFRRWKVKKILHFLSIIQHFWWFRICKDKTLMSMMQIKVCLEWQ